VIREPFWFPFIVLLHTGRKRTSPFPEKELFRFLEYLQNTGTFKELLNLSAFETDLHEGWALDSNLPIHLIRDVLIKRKGGSSPPDLEALISKETLPLRPGRRDPRKVRAQSVISFNYRFS